MKMHYLSGNRIEKNRWIMTGVNVFKKSIFMVVTGDKECNELISGSVGNNKAIELLNKEGQFNVVREERPQARLEIRH